MNQDLERYLNDHLAGSFGAVSLIDDVATRQEEEPEREFFLRLKESVETDQALLKRLIDHGGMEQSKPLQVTGTLAAKAGRLKLLWEGLRPGELGMFEALEMITLGIQGKRLLWVMLGEIAPQVECRFCRTGTGGGPAARCGRSAADQSRPRGAQRLSCRTRRAESMRVLIIFAHPRTDSFCAGLAKAFSSSLMRCGIGWRDRSSRPLPPATSTSR